MRPLDCEYRPLLLQKNQCAIIRIHGSFRQEMSEFEERAKEAISNPSNVGEMSDADASGTAGSADCGDMLRMWLKFTEKDGKKVIDRASFQSFGCQTAIAVASMATELLKGKTPEEARELEPDDLTGDLGPLPPMKIHCGQLVEGALKNALGEEAPAPEHPATNTLSSSLNQSQGKVRVVPLDPSED